MRPIDVSNVTVADPGSNVQFSSYQYVPDVDSFHQLELFKLSAPCAGLLVVSGTGRSVRDLWDVFL